jgi:hypothetical protein
MCRFRAFVKGDLILEAVCYLYGTYEAGFVARFHEFSQTDRIS